MNVGRVGGLAVALGIGIAVLGGPGCGVAWADSSGSTASSSAPNSHDSTSRPPRSSTLVSTPKLAAKRAARAAKAAEAGLSAGEQAATSGDDGAKPNSTAAPEKSNAASKRQRVFAPTAGEVNARELSDAVKRLNAKATNIPTPVKLSVVDTTGSAAHPLGAARITPAVTMQVEVMSSVATNVLHRVTTDSEPGAPAQTPLLFTLLAVARREFGPTSAPPAMATGATGATVAAVDVSALSAARQVTATAAAATAAPATFTGQPSVVAQAFVLFARVTKALGVDVQALVTPLIESESPPAYATLGLNVQRTEFDGMPVYTISSPNPSGKYVVALHGGQFVLQPTILHWFDYAQMARDTGATIVVPIYPLAPAGTAGTVVPQMADLIADQIDQHGAENVSVYGDSAGATIALAAVQELVRRGDPVPSHLVLLSPALDLTLTNPNISLIDDPILDPEQGLKDSLLWAGDRALDDPMVSPLYGSLAGLPPTAVYSGSLELLSADVLVLQDKALATPDADFTFVLRKGLIHDWALGGLPIFPDAVAIRPDVYRQLGLVAED